MAHAALGEDRLHVPRGLLADSRDEQAAHRGLELVVHHPKEPRQRVRPFLR